MARTVSIIADATSGRFFVAEADGSRIPLNRDGYSTDKNALRALARHYDFKAVPGCPYAYSIEATDREIAPAGHDRACIVADHEVAVMQREAAATVARSVEPAPPAAPAPASLPAPQPVRTSRRSIFGAIFGAGAFAALGAPVAAFKLALRDSDANRLPDHAAFWSRPAPAVSPRRRRGGSLPRRFRPRSARRSSPCTLRSTSTGTAGPMPTSSTMSPCVTRRAASRTTSSTGWATAFGRCSPTSTGRTAIIPDGP